MSAKKAKVRTSTPVAKKSAAEIVKEQAVPKVATSPGKWSEDPPKVSMHQPVEPKPSLLPHGVPVELTDDGDSLAWAKWATWAVLALAAAGIAGAAWMVMR